MAKTQYKSAWFCSNCGNESAKWEGRCPACGEWNTMVEEKVSTAKTATRGARGTLRLQSELSRPQKVSEIQTTEQERITLPSAELNRVLGGGLVPGSMVLVGGEPGIGKSTLVLQNILSIRKRTVLYVSGEESAMQLKMRADRIGRMSDNCYIVTETSLNNMTPSRPLPTMRSNRRPARSVRCANVRPACSPMPSRPTFRSFSSAI